MKLLHYSHVPLNGVHSTEQDGELYSFKKPAGLWVSVGEEWKEWCEGEDFNPAGLKHVHEIVLSERANICEIKNSRGMLAFHKAYKRRNMWNEEVIDWKKVAEFCDGIIIAPYQYEHRLKGVCSKWYYGWDVASGCIWNADAIAKIIPVTGE